PVPGHRAGSDADLRADRGAARPPSVPAAGGDRDRVHRGHHQRDRDPPLHLPGERRRRAAPQTRGLTAPRPRARGAGRAMSDDPTSGPARIILVGGGARSGKSRFALARARQLGARRVFVATGQALDAEMAERIAAHARTRGQDFRTVEEPLALPEALSALGGDADVVVVDCLTLWLSNLVCRGDGESLIAEPVDALAAALP